MDYSYFSDSKKISFTLPNSGLENDIVLFSQISDFRLKIYISQNVYFLNQLRLDNKENTDNPYDSVQCQDNMDIGVILLNELNKRIKIHLSLIEIEKIRHEEIDNKLKEREFFEIGYEDFGDDIQYFEQITNRDLSYCRVFLTKAMNRIIHLYGFSEGSGFYAIDRNPHLVAKFGKKCHISALKLL